MHAVVESLKQASVSCDRGTKDMGAECQERRADHCLHERKGDSTLDGTETQGLRG
jgi:hypothetical protein